MRMALDLGLHRALEKLSDKGGKTRSEEEERNLGMSGKHLNRKFGVLKVFFKSCFCTHLAVSLLV